MNYQTTSINGRTLAYNEGGDIGGYPVLFFHGCPSSRLIASLLSEAATDLNIRLIAPDRPGMGRSENDPNRTITRWANDMVDFIRTLDLDRYSVLGHSAGGPHALACAADTKASTRLDSVGLLSGIAPSDASRSGMAFANRLVFAIADHTPWLLGPAFRIQAAVFAYSSPESVTQAYSNRKVGNAPDDIDPIVAQVMKRDMLETFASGTEGVLRESVLLTQPWGIDFSAIDVPVLCRYGEDDTNVPPAHGRHIVKAVPDAELTIVPDTDHLSILTKQSKPLLRELRP